MTALDAWLPRWRAGYGGDMMRRRRAAGHVVANASAVTMFVAMVVLTACSSSATRPQPTNVVLIGDSLAEQAAPYLAPLIGTKTLVPQFFGGTAPCDWLDDDLRIDSRSVVVISFTGDSLSPCMSDGNGGHLEGQAIIDKYRADVTALIADARTAGARTLVVGQPVHADTASSEIVAGINEVYTDLSSDKDVRFVDAGAAVENPDGTFAHSLPCLAAEAACDPSGDNVVRSDDGLHFCPGSPPVGPCPEYSSGAFRFATAIADAVNEA